MAVSEIGISGFASYLPRYRVRLDDWCRWTGDSWDKVRTVIGTGFRMRGSNENAYTMAATAVTIIPLLIVFFCAQKYFVEGIVTTGIKG